MSAVLISSPRALMAEVNPYELEQPMVCSYEYDEGEPSIFWPTELAHPGCPPCVELLSCRIGGVEVIDMLSRTQMDRIEEALMELHE